MLQKDAERSAATPRRLAEMGDCAKEAPREPRWHECGLEEKVERIRRELLSLREATRWHGMRIGEAHDLAHDHSHDPLGRVLRPAHGGGSNRLIAGEGRSFDPLA